MKIEIYAVNITLYAKNKENKRKESSGHQMQVCYRRITPEQILYNKSTFYNIFCSLHLNY